MDRKITQFLAETRRRYFLAKSFVQRYWKRGLAIAVVIFIVIKKDVDIDLQLSGSSHFSEESWLDFSEISASFLSFFEKSEEKSGFFPFSSKESVNTSMLDRPSGSRLISWKRKSSDKEDNLANTFSNMTYSAGEFATSESEKARIEKRRKQEKYIRSYAAIARREMKAHGIPASITLAQGLLESNAGESRLALRNNNHFGIKCFSRSCKKGHCSNFTDDHHKDFFRKYSNPEESFKSHSNLLKGKRYRKLFKLNPGDYQGWAHGLKSAGYATDRYYAEKLINLIEELDLNRFDR